MEGSVVTLESESMWCLDLEEAVMPELEVDNWVELSRLTAHLPVSERPLHSDTQVVGEATRQEPTLSAAGSLQYELTFHCGVCWWLREAS